VGRGVNPLHHFSPPRIYVTFAVNTNPFYSMTVSKWTTEQFDKQMIKYKFKYDTDRRVIKYIMDPNHPELTRVPDDRVIRSDCNVRVTAVS